MAGPTAAIGDVGGVDADGLVEQHAADMRGGAGPARAELHLALVRLGIGDEFRKVVRGQILARDQHQADIGDQRDRDKIGGGVVQRLLGQRLIERMGADRGEHEHVAIGCRLGHAQRAGHAAAARHIVHDHLLADGLAQILRQDAAEHVDGSAGREWNDHGHRPRRPFLSLCDGCRHQRGKGQRRDRRSRSGHLLLHEFLDPLSGVISYRGVGSLGATKSPTRPCRPRRS
jgi:hypothetical protein